MSQKADTFEIILGRVEHINASHFNCLSFAKASDMVNGINVRLSNMVGGYPFSFEGVTWRDSETLYPKSVIRISLCRTAKRNPLIFPI